VRVTAVVLVTTLIVMLISSSIRVRVQGPAPCPIGGQRARDQGNTREEVPNPDAKPGVLIRPGGVRSVLRCVWV